MSHILFALSLASFMLLTSLVTKPDPAPQYDLLIKNGRIVDGSGEKAYSADLAIKGDRIARIGDLAHATASRVIDARGLIVAPGFIDMLGQRINAARPMLWMSRCRKFLRLPAAHRSRSRS